MVDLDAVVRAGIESQVSPGAAWAVGSPDGATRGFAGNDIYGAGGSPVTDETLWDLASLTKVVGTTTLAMILYEGGCLPLDRPVADFLPAFASNGKAEITIRNLLAHNSGLAASGAFAGRRLSPPEIFAAIDAAHLSYPTSSKAIYSDIGFIALGRVLEVIGGDTLDKLLAQRVFEPLGMSQTFFNPPLELRDRCAPSEEVEPWRMALRGPDSETLREIETAPDGVRYIRGEVHDRTTMMLGGVAGHAGLFSTLDDLVIWIRSILGLERSLVGEKTIALFVTRTGDAGSRALGWDTNWQFESSAGPSWPETAFGHTGFTGTSVWADLDSRQFAILLTNRVHPKAEGDGIRAFRLEFHEATARTLRKPLAM